MSLANIKLNPDDHCFLNQKKPLVKEQFEYEIPDEYFEVVLDYLNKLRADYISWSNNELKKTKHPKRKEKFYANKNQKLRNFEHKAQIMMNFSGVKFRGDGGNATQMEVLSEKINS